METRKTRQRAQATARKRLAKIPEGLNKPFPFSCKGNRYDWKRAADRNGKHYAVRGKIFFAGA